MPCASVRSLRSGAPFVPPFTSSGVSGPLLAVELRPDGVQLFHGCRADDIGVIAMKRLSLSAGGSLLPLPLRGACGGVTW